MTDLQARNLFPGRSTHSLSNDEKGKLCIILSDKFGLSTKQIADALSMPEYLVKQILSSKDYGKKKSWNAP